MKVLVLSEKDYAFCRAKVEAELHCARVDLMLCRAWEKAHLCKWYARVWLRKRAIEAQRLARIISQ